MGFLVLIIISVFFWWTLLRYSYSQKRVRERSTQYWDTFPWVDEGQQKFSLWTYLVATVISFIPVINIIIVFVIAILYCMQTSGRDGSDGWELEDERLVLRAPYFKWFKWLNKQI